jgi:hypothetical protein
MIANAPDVLEAHGVIDRCRMVGGNFFEQIPAGGDIYVVKAVVRGWDDAACCRMLRTVRRAMREDSGLLIIEPLMDLQFSRGTVLHPAGTGDSHRGCG